MNPSTKDVYGSCTITVYDFVLISIIKQIFKHNCFIHITSALELNIVPCFSANIHTYQVNCERCSNIKRLNSPNMQIMV